HDPLTGLPNRSLLGNLLHQAIQLARRNNRRLAVLFIDLDHFKYINDSLGHDAGDQLLQEVASRLKASLRESDVVARLGGDEFLVVLPDIEGENYGSQVARKLITAVASPYQICGQKCQVTASIGIATFPEGGEDGESLVQNAD